MEKPKDNPIANVQTFQALREKVLRLIDEFAKANGREPTSIRLTLEDRQTIRTATREDVGDKTFDKITIEGLGAMKTFLGLSTGWPFDQDAAAKTEVYIANLDWPV